MKNFTFLVAIACLALVGFGTLSAQDESTVWEDDFSADVPDYLTGDISGTIWQGALVNSGTMGDPLNNTVDMVAKNMDGALFLSSSNGGFEGNHDDGLYIYRVIPAGVDFEAIIQIVGGDFMSFNGAEVSYNSAGIIVRDANHGDKNYIYSMFFELYNIHSMIKRIEDGAQQELVNSMDDYSLAEYSWMKLEKFGETFTMYLSTDGVDWGAPTAATTEFAALNSVDLEVGLSQCNFYTDPAQENQNPTAILDNFKLEAWYVADGVKKNSVSSPISVYFANKKVIVDNNSTESMGSVKLYSIDGAMVYSAKAIDAQRIEIPVSNSGIYIMDATVNGNRYTQKVVVR